MLIKQPVPGPGRDTSDSPGELKSGGRGVPRWRHAVLAAAGAILLGTSSWAGISGFAADLRVAFLSAPWHAIPPELSDCARILKARIPREASVIFLGNQNPPDNWYSRLWQRALYPRRLLILERGQSAVQLDTTGRPRMLGFDELRATYPIRYAISAGNPPEDLGFLSHVELPSIPGYPYVNWFGELRP